MHLLWYVKLKGFDGDKRGALSYVLNSIEHRMETNLLESGYNL
jgi:hypothetical protein